MKNLVKLLPKMGARRTPRSAPSAPKIFRKICFATWIICIQWWKVEQPAPKTIVSLSLRPGMRCMFTERPVYTHALCAARQYIAMAGLRDTKSDAFSPSMFIWCRIICSGNEYEYQCARKLYVHVVVPSVRLYIEIHVSERQRQYLSLISKQKDHVFSCTTVPLNVLDCLYSFICLLQHPHFPWINKNQDTGIKLNIDYIPDSPLIM